MIRSEKLRNKLIESTHQLPYENILLVDLPGEIWKPFPIAPYDENYVISNKGRVKRLAHIITKSHGVSTRLPEKVLKQTVCYKTNRSLNERTYYLTCKVCRKRFMTARMVYYTFVEPFDLEDQEWNVRYKDCNGLNCSPDNLYLFERCNLTRWVKDNNRVKALPPISKDWWEELDPVKYPGAIDPVRVAKYSLTGDLIEIFPTIVAAAQHLGVSRTIVARRMYGKILNKKCILKAVDINQDPPAKIEVKPTEDKIIDAQKYGVPEGKVYPFQYVSLEDLLGEQWKVIPDTDQVFWVSDLGRVKSVDRLIHLSLHGSYPKSGKIIHQVVKQRGKRLPFLAVGFTPRKKKVHYQMSHLVYKAFIGEVPRKYAVTHKDQDLFNCKAENLVLRSLSDLRRQYIQQGRITTGQLKKPIAQYTLDGQHMATYASLGEAKEKTGFVAAYMSECAKGKKEKYKGFKWKFL